MIRTLAAEFIRGHRDGLAAAAMILLGAWPRLAVAQEGGAADSTVADPLGLYLEALGDSTASTFTDPALEALSISDAQVDSLMRAYQKTGKSPAAPGGPKWGFDFGIADARYNRVEGVNVSPELMIRPPLGHPTELRGWVGYGWSSKEPTGGAEARYELVPDAGRPTLHASWAREVTAYGSGLVVGNSVTSLVFGNDYSDYFRGEGWSSGIDLAPGPFGFGLTWRSERQESLENAAEFSVFENDDTFRPNPAIDDGDLRALDLGAEWSDRPQAPWTARLRARTAGGALGGDFEYVRARAEVVARRRVWLGDRIVGALAGGWLGDGAPFQALHHLGGFTTLRGYDINEFPSRSFAHARLDYEIGTNIFQWIPFVHRFRLQPVAFGDAASIFAEQARDGSEIRHDDPQWRFSVGTGVQMNLLGTPGGAGQVRFDIARRLDRDDDAVTYRGSITIAR